MPFAAPPADLRAHARRAVCLTGRILCADGAAECAVVNVSAGGARLRAAGDFAAGLEVRLELPACGGLPAVVVWAREGELGLRFTGDPAEVACALIGLATYG